MASIRGRRLAAQFRRQVVLSCYLADIFASEVGVRRRGSWRVPRAAEQLRERSDERRDRWFQHHGYTVLRLSDAVVLKNTGAAVARIAEQVAALGR